MDLGGLTFKDGLLAGIMLAAWWSNVSRRRMGERLGSVEQDVRELLALLRPTREAIIPSPGGEHVR